mmetsp:Transcript_46213/g.100439  ORF Transcript_46213/g.100439 Transcript_46213/m.100439 type:complete len:179 (+) Transcript_46213:106-642(+)
MAAAAAAAAAAAEAVAKAKKGSKAGKDPFIQPIPLKGVFQHFSDRRTGKIALDRVPYVLRAMGFTVYGEEEAKIKAEVEKVDGLGKPVSFQTLDAWCEENKKAYTRSIEDAYSAVGTLCHETIIGHKNNIIVIPWLKHLVGEVGDKIKPDVFDKIMACEGPLQANEMPLEDFMKFLQK